MDTGTRLAAFEPAFHADDDQVAEYRTVSVLAIISLLVGLASPLCLMSRLFLVIPLLGAVVSILALRRIAASGGSLTGRWAASAGLVLCVACGAATFSRDAVTRYLRTAQAEEFGRSWLRLVSAGETEQAFRLTVEGARPPTPPDPAAPPTTTSPLEEFLKSELIKKISAAGPNSDIKLVGTQEYNAYSPRHFLVSQRFSIPHPGAADGAESPETIESLLKLERSRFPGQRQSRWLVSSYSPAPAPSD